MAGTAQNSPDGDASVARKVIGLVESARQPPQGMERNGHDGVDPFEQRRTRFTHQPPERRGEEPAFLELERVHELTKRPVVPARAPGD